jgi:NAD(P)H-dependent FMN reductase
VVGISGSLRPTSATRAAVSVALDGAAEIGAQVRMLDLTSYQLEFADVTQPPSPSALQLRQDIAQSHGIIIGTPEYHASFSGILKHALDLMGFEQFEGKIVGLVGISGGKMGAVNALNSLRIVCRSLHAWVVPDQISIGESGRMFDASGQIADPRTVSSLREVGRQVARFSFLHSSEQAREFLRLWEAAPQNPGGQDR